MGERLDAETVRELMFRYFHEMRSAIERHGGTVEKFVGDAVMAVFGVPEAHEDDPQRACRSALEMMERLVRLNEDFKQRYGSTLALRIGINTGEVVAGDPSTQQTFVSGDAVNTAARLEQAARPGEILIGALTHDLTVNAVLAESVPAIEAKGKAVPVQAWRLVSERSAPSFVQLHATPLVGRQIELDQLISAFELARSQRHFQLITVVGEPGVGKSRLAQEFEVRIGPSARALHGRCSAYGEGITYAPLAEIVREAAQIREEHSLEEARARVLSLAEPAVAEAACALIGLSDQRFAPAHSAWATLKLLEALASKRPLVVVVEDVHWAEEPLIDLMTELGERGRAPVLLVLTARPDLLERRPGWPVRVRLAPLSGEETMALIATSRLEPAERDAIAQRSGGNPLFMEQLAAYVQETRNMGAIPPTLTALLAARLDRLPARERACAERGAIEGERFHRGAVSALLDADAARDLEALVGRQLIRTAPAEFMDDAAYRFAHALVRDAAYASTPKRLRADLHERFSVWLEAKAADHFPELDAILGYHLEQAYRYRIELGPADERSATLARLASDRLASAGRQARDRRDYRTAAGLLSRAASLREVDAESRLELLPDLGEALVWGGDLGRADSVLTSAIELAAASGKPRLEWLARVRRSMLRELTQDVDYSDQRLVEASEAILAFEKLGDERGLVEALALEASARWARGELVARERTLGRALESARRLGDLRLEAELRIELLATLVIGPNPLAATAAYADEVLAWARDRGDRTTEAEARFYLAQVVGMRGDIKTARVMIAEAAAVLDETMSSVASGSAESFSCWVELLNGETAEAERLARRSYETLDREGERSNWQMAAAYLARALCNQGRYQEAVELTEATKSLANTNGNVWGLLNWLGAQAKIVAAQGDVEQAERLARQAVTVAERTDTIDVYAESLLDLAQVLRTAGKPEEAKPLVERALELWIRWGAPLAAARTRAILDELTDSRTP